MIPQVLFVFPATPELHGYPLRCKRKKRGKERTDKETCVAVLFAVCILYKAMRWDGRKVKMDESPGEKRTAAEK